MESNQNLQTKFEDILGSRNVYFQPPASVKLQFPAIIFRRKSIEPTYASNGSYIPFPSCEVILIDKNPNSEFIEKILALPYCRHDRHYTADNLNHDVFTIYNVKGGLLNV